MKTREVFQHLFDVEDLNARKIPEIFMLCKFIYLQLLVTVVY